MKKRSGPVDQPSGKTLNLKSHRPNRLGLYKLEMGKVFQKNFKGLGMSKSGGLSGIC